MKIVTHSDKHKYFLLSEEDKNHIKETKAILNKLIMEGFQQPINDEYDVWLEEAHSILFDLPDYENVVFEIKD